MKKKSKVLAILLALVMIFSMATMTGCGGDDAEATWGDRYVALLDSGEARDYEDYDAMQAELAAIAEEIGATYVYVLTPGTDGVPDIAGKSGEGAHYLITVDGCDDPDPWAENYGWEIQFTEAWEGTPAAARSAWDDGGAYCWSAFAPVYDSEGNVVCLLGIDYPCDEVVAANPEWNRDCSDWNGFEDEITGDVPQDVADMRELVTLYAAKYAKILSGQATWADEYVALLASGEARDYAGYEDLRAVLEDITEATGTTYCYVLTPANGQGEPDETAAFDETGEFLITVDPCEDPDDWAENYGWEVQFTEAWEGTPAAARSAWNDSEDLQCWSAFAPVYSTSGSVVAILGFDYPCTEVAQANPEWNRDAAEWNGFKDEITGDVPADVAEMREYVTELAAKYAKAL